MANYVNKDSFVRELFWIKVGIVMTSFFFLIGGILNLNATKSITTLSIWGIGLSVVGLMLFLVLKSKLAVGLSGLYVVLVVPLYLFSLRADGSLAELQHGKHVLAHLLSMFGVVGFAFYLGIMPAIRIFRYLLKN